MLEKVKEHIVKLISLYEAEKQRGDALATKLDITEKALAESNAQIAELKRQVDNLKLTSAFSGGAQNNALAKERVDKLIAEIDKCIRFLEK